MREVLKDAVDVLACRIPAGRVEAFGPRHLGFGMLCTWVAGMGRYWDDPKANFLQHAGLVSVGYVFILSVFLYVSALPILRQRARYFRILTYVTFTAPPALLYAIPVERWMPAEEAATLNLWFLAFVAGYRVLLWISYLWHVVRLGLLRGIVIALFPLALVATPLSFFGLLEYTMRVMGGIRDASDQFAKDAWGLALQVSGSSLALLTIAYVYCLWEARRPKA